MTHHPSTTLGAGLRGRPSLHRAPSASAFARCVRGQPRRLSQRGPVTFVIRPIPCIFNRVQAAATIGVCAAGKQFNPECHAATDSDARSLADQGKRRCNCAARAGGDDVLGERRDECAAAGLPLGCLGGLFRRVRTDWPGSAVQRYRDRSARGSGDLPRTEDPLDPRGADRSGARSHRTAGSVLS